MLGVNDMLVRDAITVDAKLCYTDTGSDYMLLSNGLCQLFVICGVSFPGVST